MSENVSFGNRVLVTQNSELSKGGNMADETVTSGIAEGGVQPVVVEGRPIENKPTAEGIKRKEFMDQFEAQQAQPPAGGNLIDRLNDSDLGFYDDVIANRKYITKLDPDDTTTPLGTPAFQLRRLPWPNEFDSRLGALEGVSVLREDGSFYSIPPGVTSLDAVVDPASGERLVPDKVDPKRQKIRDENAKAETAALRHQAGTKESTEAPKKAKKGKK
jgi:hypothetical protein